MTKSCRDEGLTWRRVETEVVRDESEESIGGVDELHLTSASGLDHLKSLGEDRVAGLDLLPAELAERHLLRVDLELDERPLHLLDVEDHRDQFLDGLGQLRPEKRDVRSKVSRIRLGTQAVFGKKVKTWGVHSIIELT